MNIIIYILIFFSKILENALATLRLIFISNGKKTIGAILQFASSLIWVISTGIVVVDMKDPIKIFCFCTGCLIGSYVGSYIEEKLALGNNMIMCIIDNKRKEIIEKIRKHGYRITVVKGEGKDSEKLILFIMIKRKNLVKITNYIKELDKNAILISEVATGVNGNFVR